MRLSSDALDAVYPKEQGPGISYPNIFFRFHVVNSEYKHISDDTNMSLINWFRGEKMLNHNL
jgi:hypothetical protein